MNGAGNVSEGYCEITCDRCDCCPSMMTMLSRRGLDTFRMILQLMANTEGSKSVAVSLQNPSFVSTVFAPTNDAFSRLFALLKTTREEFLTETSLISQVSPFCSKQLNFGSKGNCELNGIEMIMRISS